MPKNLTRPGLAVPNDPSCSSIRFGSCAEPDDRLSSSQLIPMGVRDGRRIYVHALSFDDVASRDYEAAVLIYDALASLPAIKLVHHDIVEESVALQLMEAARAELLAQAIASRWCDGITRALRRVGVRQRGPAPPVPLLASNEIVEATCLDSSYYTFATSVNAARRMYADVLRLRDVRRFVLLGGDAYRDLTMVRGRRLVLLPSDDAPRSDSTSRTPIPQSTITFIKNATLRTFSRDLRQLIDRTIPNPSAQESSVLLAFYRKCVHSVRRTVLHCSSEIEE